MLYRPYSIVKALHIVCIYSLYILVLYIGYSFICRLLHSRFYLLICCKVCFYGNCCKPLLIYMLYIILLICCKAYIYTIYITHLLQSRISYICIYIISTDCCKAFFTSELLQSLIIISAAASSI